MHQNLLCNSEAVAFTCWGETSNISWKSESICRSTLALLEASQVSTAFISNEYHEDENV